ncbi:hypothetical protein [Ralstonia phage RP13]|nr:hypothetical protein [Ralstonia phage RP13]
MEPEYLITPVPIQLVHGGMNWGLGIMGRTPAFSYESLIEAYFADDYTKLESNYGYQIIKDRSTLKDLWETGVGRVTLKSKCIRASEDKILMVTSGEIFKPALGEFKKWVEMGQVMIGNESGKDIGITVSRVPRARNVNMDEMYQYAVRASTMSRSYNILVVEDERVRTIGIKEWMDLTVSRYTKFFNESKNDRIASREKTIEVLTIMPQVARMIIDQKTDEQILAAMTELNQDILNSIKRRSIGSLRRTDYEPELNKLRTEIANIKKEDATVAIRAFSQSMFNS